MIYFPEFNGGVVHWLCALSLVAAPIVYLTESRGLNLGYSKFASRAAALALPSRVGMLILYAPSVVLFPCMLLAHGVEWTTWHLVTAALISLHFAKRCLEALYVHRYSGVMNLESVVFICLWYSAATGFLGYVAATEVDAELIASPAFHPWYLLGALAWIAGTGLNYLHHELLARLRAPGETGYKLPTAGLFRWIACPHYLAELLAWWGYALVFHHVAAAALAVIMTGYLFGRADSTLRWYRDRLGHAVPRDWKRIVPRVF